MQEEVKYTVKLYGLNTMTVGAVSVTVNGDLLQFAGTPVEGVAPIHLTVNSSRLEYFGPEGKFDFHRK